MGGAGAQRGRQRRDRAAAGGELERRRRRRQSGEGALCGRPACIVLLHAARHGAGRQASQKAGSRARVSPLWFLELAAAVPRSGGRSVPLGCAPGRLADLAAGMGVETTCCGALRAGWAACHEKDDTIRLFSNPRRALGQSRLHLRRQRRQRWSGLAACRLHALIAWLHPSRTLECGAHCSLCEVQALGAYHAPQMPPWPALPPAPDVQPSHRCMLIMYASTSRLDRIDWHVCPADWLKSWSILSMPLP